MVKRMEPQNDFFTLQSLFTFVGTVGATTVIVNGLHSAFDLKPAWLGLAVAEILCVGAVMFSHHQPQAGMTPVTADYFVAVINGFLVYCSAAGATRLGERAIHGSSGPQSSPIAQGKAEAAPRAPAKRRFFRAWF